ncbi:histidine N-alpha-methyltransferase-like [Pecten maximus]|uniref:histidine N-alpha-methyltransferase-like n=1 Tax=Pecten maximus TaxID=6579 RepID=UPI00145818CA|nr:histidine N-alpha-methyltransferase-like [Pecten maximus]XP_033750257.1 histidine N-alpha-methyltransferase-like [Pecten maximus]
MDDTSKQLLVKGLTSFPKYLPTWYNYDELGSELEDKCTVDNTGYYLRRSQISILETSIQKIIPSVPYDFALVDLGSGSCSKTRYFLDEMLLRQKRLMFYPVDISGEFLMKTVEQISNEYGERLSITPVAANYENGIEQLRYEDGPKVILWFGSIINLSYDDQVDKLKLISSLMTEKCHLVFSVDITQDKKAVLRAYNDDAGLEKKFFQNGIVRLNKEEESQIHLDQFQYKVDFISDSSPEHMSYFRAYLQAKEHLRYKIPGLNLDIEFEKGEPLYLHEGVGLSCKYTREQIQNLTARAGLLLTDTWTDEKRHAMFCRCKVMDPDQSVQQHEESSSV